MSSGTALACVFLALAFAPVAAAAQQPWIDQDGAQYWIASGTPGTLRATIGPDSLASDTLAADGCAYTKLQPSHGNARVQALVRLGGSDVYVDFGQLPADDAIQMGGSTDGSSDGISAWHPSVPALARLAGYATLLADDRPVLDPLAGGESPFAAILEVTSKGFRDPQGRIQTTDGQEFNGVNGAPSESDLEMHLRVRSTTTGSPSSESLVFQGPNDPLPILWEARHQWQQSFPNNRFGGTAAITLTATTSDPTGSNELLLRTRDPEGNILAEAPIRPRLGADATATVEVALDRFGDYVVEVTGDASMLQYRVEVVQTATAPIDLVFWWEDVKFGSDAQRSFGECGNRFGGITTLSPVAMLPPAPPQLRAAPLILGAVAFLVAVLVAGKLIHQSISKQSPTSSRK